MNFVPPNKPVLARFVPTQTCSNCGAPGQREPACAYCGVALGFLREGRQNSALSAHRSLKPPPTTPPALAPPRKVQE